MRTIVTGCREKSDVSFRKTQFWADIQSYNILCNDQIWDASKIVKEFNIEDASFIPDGLDEEMIHKFNKAFDQLNIISHERRHGIHSYLGNCRSIYASHSNEMLTLARNIDNHNRNKDEIKIPLCVPLQYITVRLWLHTNRGLVPKNPPVSFSILARAQFVAARKTGEYLGDRLKCLQQQTLGLSQEQINARLADLRSIKTKPEEITLDDWAYSDSTFNDFIEKERFQKNQTFELLEKAQEEKESLEKALQSKDKDLQEETRIKEKYISEAECAKTEASKAKREIAELKYSKDHDTWDEIKSKERIKVESNYKAHRNWNIGILLGFIVSVFGIILAAFITNGQAQAHFWGVVTSVCSIVITYCVFVFAPVNRKEIKWTVKSLYNKSLFKNFMIDWETEWIRDNPEPRLEDYYK